MDSNTGAANNEAAAVAKGNAFDIAGSAAAAGALALGRLPELGVGIGTRPARPRPGEPASVVELD